MFWKDLAHVKTALLEKQYISNEDIDMTVFLAATLEKPILIEGPPGVGKTEIAKVLSSIYNTELIRLQCYEGLGFEHAIYEWNYQRQLLALKLVENDTLSLDEKESIIFDEKYLLKRPLLQSITAPKSPVLLLDEIDRSDEEFESFLLEILSDWQVTIPEIGTIVAQNKPHVIITSNRTRELSEALRRRCLYLWIDYPDFDKELKIIQRKLPNINEKLSEQICLFMQEVRTLKLNKTPSVSETMDWAFALSEMHYDHLDKSIIEQTLGIVLKDWKDIRKSQDALSELLEKVGVVQKLPS